MALKNPNEWEREKTIIFFVRHGDRLPNGARLTKLGKKQAKEVAREFKKIKNEVDVIYCSSMSRAKETAKEIEKVLKKKPKTVDELSEFNKIIFEQKIFHPLYWKMKRYYRKAVKALDNILEKHMGKVIVIVGHGGWIRLMLKKKLGLSMKQCRHFDHHNCHITRLRFKGKKLDWISYYNSKGLHK